MAKPKHKYVNLSISRLAQITRERGLDKPDVTDAGQWGDWLAEQDAENPQAAVEVSQVSSGITADETPIKPDLNDMTKRELTDLALEMGLDVLPGASKAEIIVSIQDASGMAFEPNPFDENKFEDAQG